MEVKAKYKRTQAGIIPNGWEIATVGSIGAFASGQGISIAGLHLESSTDYPVPVFGGNGMAGYTQKPLITESTVVIGRVGQKCGSVNLTHGPAWITDNALYPRSMSRSIDIRFFALALQAAGLNDVKNRNDLPLMTQSILNSVRIILPKNLSEQRAIAAALSDVDALLAKLDQLIVKKRNIKQAALQQLLTGKKRLPGFSGKWEVKWLGEIFNFSGGYSVSRDQLTFEGHCYLHYGDIHKSSKTFIDVHTEFQNIPKLNISLKRVSAPSLLSDGDVVFVDASEDNEGASKHIVIVNKEGTPYIAGLHTIVAKNKVPILSNVYKRYCFQTKSIKDQFYYYSVGTKVTGISKTNITKIVIPVPSLPEQSAIASILSDMDAEIAALEARRDKTHALKQGMMQELLTGRIRLV